MDVTTQTYVVLLLLAALVISTVARLVIRRRIGFDGLLMSDDLDMEALSGSVPERAERAIAAGCDLALNCWADMADMAGIAARLPALSDAGAQRLDRALVYAAGSPDITRQRDLIAKRDALLALDAARA